jgi:hypothetical protein
MVSSSETGSLTGPRTPTDTQIRMANSGLSPPVSQSASQQAGTELATNSPTVGFERKGENKGAVEGKSQASQPYQPGASWMNKRAEEEYQRAMEFVVDKDFSLRTFPGEVNAYD